MDPRKQKRLGPAPIASFEKSFEDTTTLTTTTTTSPSSTLQHAVSATTCTTQIAAAAHDNNVIGVTQGIYEDDAKDFYGNGGNTKMDINDSGRTCKKPITTKTITTTTAATTKMAATPGAAAVRESKQLSDHSVGGGGGFETTTGNSKIKQDTSGNTTTSSNNNRITNTTTSAATTKRAPPLKATTAANNPSTLVSSQCGSLGGAFGDFKGATSLCTPSTPRIELSRASSSSHHEEDSRESSPENVFEQVGTGTLQETLDMGFREEGALELRSSTEELYFMDPTQKKEEEEKLQQQQQQLQQQQQQQMQQQLLQQTKRASPHMFKIEDHQTYLQQHQRKDSASSEVAALLCISGRTSRISSVGSQGSAVSRLSAVSGISRSPSPHRMLLETSFCGPKPVEGITDGTVGANLAEAPTVALLEQVLLARARDTTQAIFAEGIKVESSPKKKPPTSLTNGDAKLTAKIKAQNRPDTGTLHKTTMGAQRKSTKSPGQMIVGKTPSGTEYIRINLKPDCMYDDKGIAPHEKVVEAPNTLAPVYATKTQTKPASLSLTQKSKADNLLTPTASPKPTRKDKENHGSRSPSPNTVSVSRKSSFSSLFRFGGGKDSPDSPRDRARPRSKSKERGQTPQSQNATPNKQKSVLAIFKPGKRGSSTGVEGSKTSKSSSPTDAHEMQPLQPRSKSHTPIMTATGSRPNSSLKYYEDPVEGYIHIPLHTPPEEKETRKLFQSIQQLNAEPVRPQATAITMSDLATAVKNLKPVGARKNSVPGPPTAPRPPPPPPTQKRIENLDAIHSLPQDDNDKERTWSLEVNRHSSQDSQETVGSGESYASAIRVTTQRPQLAEVKEHVVHENGVEAEAEIHRLPSQESTTSQAEIRVVETKATINTSAVPDDCTTAQAKERRRLMFATRVGSGSQEQIFATQFSISKTESISSHMSEQTQDTLSESITENFKRQNTVIKKSPEDLVQPPPPPPPQQVEKKEPFKRQPQAIAQIEEQREIFHMSITKESLQKTKESLREAKEKHIMARKKSISTSEDEKPKPGPPVVIRRKPSGGSGAIGGEDKQRQHPSRSTSEDDNEVQAVANHRHSRYLENFDVRKKYHENVQGATRKPRKQSGGQEFNPPETKQQHHQISQEQTTTTKEQYQRKPQPQLPQPPPPSTEPSPLHTPSPSVVEAAVASPASSHHRSEPRSQSQSPVDKARQTPPKPPRTSTPTRRSQAESPTTSKSSPVANATPHVPAPKKYHSHIDRSSVLSTDEPVESSESERDSDLATVESKRRHLALNVGCIEDHESTGLVSQESFDDELPYIPTTLPEEKALGVSIIPMKERAHMEVKTCPLDRPRSTTPLNPSHLEEYIGGGKAVNTPDSPFELHGPPSLVRGEKLRISLPRKDSKKDVQNAKSPRRISNASGKSWFEFAEEGLRATAHLERKDSNKQLLQQKPPPPPPPTQIPKKQPAQAKPKTPTLSKPPVTTPKASTQRKLSGHWIDFENIPEKRKPPKKITTLPRDSVTSSTAHSSHNRSTLGRTLPSSTTCTKSHAFSQQHKHQHQPDVAASTMTATTDGCMPHYNYVKPEDCQCECHESKTKDAHHSSSTTETTTTTATTPPTTNNNNSKAQGVDLLPKGEDMLPLLSQDSHEGIEPSDSSREYSCYTDDELDLPTRSSSRSKSSSSKLDEFPRRDAAHSPRNRKFPDK